MNISRVTSWSLLNISDISTKKTSQTAHPEVSPCDLPTDHLELMTCGF